MTTDAPNGVPLNPLRMRLVYFSAASMFATILLIPSLYLFDPPLDFEDFLRVLQQILPVFIGFLVSAIGFAFGNSAELKIDPDRYKIISFILICSYTFYWIGLFAIGGLFLWSHSKYAPIGQGMPKEIFFGTFTILMSVVTGVAGLISTKIFMEGSKTATDSREGEIKP
jgi:hypothetical protein